ncbi:MAG: zinc dependent phospholipase C family protein [Halanaerobiales bacterium]|nr:zinc dependent phospholipase C family protein [Halanaerobiales bacterium]
MPDLWTHIIGGDKILQGLDREWQETVNAYQSYFHLGCQGPDFFFYNDFWPWIRDKKGPKAGVKIQLERIDQLFLVASQYFKDLKASADFPLFTAYFTGFLAHYVLDKHIHPLIRRKDRGKPILHKKLEILIDCYFFNKEWGKEAYQFSPVEAIDCSSVLPQVIIDYYITILSKVHDYPANIDFINQSYRNMKKILGIFYCPHIYKRIGFSLLNCLIPVDITALIYPRRPDYNSLSGQEWQEVNLLFAQAVQEGIELIKGVQQYLNNSFTKDQLTVLFPNISFEGIVGKPGVCS